MSVDATIALTTLTNARIHLQIPASKTENDAKIERLINSASQHCATYCDRRFISQAYTEYFHGRRQNFIMPKQWPIVSVSELRISNDRSWTDASSLVDASDYSIADDDTTIVLDGFFPNGNKNIRLMSVCGYATIPYDLEHACLQMIEWWYRHNERQDIGRTSSSKGDESVGVLSEIPKHILQLLEGYKRVELPSAYSPVQNL